MFQKSIKKGWLYHPIFPSDWQSCSLYSMATWANGIAFKNIDFSKTGRPVIKIAEIKNGISHQTKYTEQMFDQSVKVQYNDLLFTWSGQPETSIDAYQWRGPEGWLNQHVYKVTTINNVNNVFFYYLLKYLKPHFIKIAKNKQTTGLGHVTKQDLSNMVVACPSLNEQLSIVHVLGTLDDKIELNRCMNKTLEEMAKALFKSWFVDFDLVRAKNEGGEAGLPRDIANLFPDRLVDSEIGKIPVGWQVGQVDDYYIVTMGQSPPGYTYNDIGEGTPFFQGSSDFGFRFPKQRKYCTAPNRMANPDDILVSVRAPVGDINVAYERCCIGRGIASLRHKLGFKSYGYYCAKDLERKMREFEQTGTVFGSINRNQLLKLPMLIPSLDTMTFYEQLIKQFDESIRLRTFQNNNLILLRDMIMPKLISGKIRINDVGNQNYFTSPNVDPITI